MLCLSDSLIKLVNLFILKHIFFLIFSSNDVFQQQQKAGCDSVMANIGKRFYHGWLLTDPV